MERTKIDVQAVAMEELKNRIIYFARVQYDMGQNYFEEYCGMNRGTIHAIKVNGPSAANVLRISNKCPELNLNWLFRGEAGGPMLLTREKEEEGRGVQAQVSAPSCYVNEAKAVFITNWDGMKDAMREVLGEMKLK